MHAMKIAIFVFSLLSCYAFAVGNNTQSSLVLKNPQHDHYWLIQSWPFTFCSKTMVRCQFTPLPSIFTVHGMWPVNAAGFLITCPDKRKPRSLFDWFEHDPRVPKLIKYLPNLKTNNRSTEEQCKFWTYEWNTHGICTLQPNEVLEYFDQVLKLRDVVDIVKLFSDENITPGGEYPLAQYKKALEKQFKSDQFGLSCYPKANKLLLNEVKVCYDALAQNPISCKLGEFNEFYRSCGTGQAKGKMIYLPKEVLA